MERLSAAQVLDVWELAWTLSPIDRALMLWAAGSGATNLAMRSIGDRDRSLLGLHAAMFGPAIDAVVNCPSCGATVEIQLDAAALAASPPAPEAIAVRAGRTHITFRAPTSADIAAIGWTDDEVAVRDRLARRCVVSARRGVTEVDPATLSAETLERIEEAIAAVEPGAAISMELRCAACDHAWEATFDAGGFLWQEIDVLARGLASDVHTLAASYGWSESDILALSPTRRRLYVEVVSQ
jgi:hypothetical protein